MLWSGWQLRWSVNPPAKELGDSLGQTAEAVVTMVDPDSLQGDAGLLHPILDESLRELFRRGAFGATAGETHVMPTHGLVPERYALFAGCSPCAPTLKEIRIAAGGIGKSSADLRIASLKWRVPASIVNGHGVDAAASACAEGLLLGAYRKNTLASEGRSLPQWDLRFVLERREDGGAWDRGFERGVMTADAVCYARELTNVPSNLLTPERFAEEAVSLAARHGPLECRVYDEKEAAAEGMGGLLAVGMGSANPPRMIMLRYSGRPDSQEWTGLIGKGVTFDTGGINLKPGQGMEEFISDMGGAAAVFGVMRGLAELRVPVNVVAVVPAAENMPSGSAFKPGDVITTYSGKTVEVLNTDAEGRIVLADGLTAAIRAGAGKLIDVATLTGAVMHALGDVTTGAIANDQPLLEAVLRASERAGEYVWQLPAHPEYRKMLRSGVADLKNHGGSWGGAIAGGLFIGAFAEDRPWVHLDIGGTAWMWEDRDLEPKGGTGVMVRTLLEHFRAEANITE
ncbi:leucyl aminopeptidase [Cohnella sp. CFH 77786]|uniref:leucyl aminopeptidase n=1 Tax=Cohnella sp. CFH 77786 TaxID=2662265 RepID=UPI001C609F89|nr:leucyl aminopeptidase [Cohnella sp. CFH 77786]MBW5446989.1 leucyl aminopeptidase [Cohnella sp. CFH 77786]